MAMEIILTNASKLLRVSFLLGLILSSSSASSKERKTGWQGNLNWTSLVDEVKQMMSNQPVCKMGHYFCEVPLSREDSREGSGEDSRENSQEDSRDSSDSNTDDGTIWLCDCFGQCMTYGGCCIDKAAREANQGVRAEPEKYICANMQKSREVYGPTDVLMVRNCHETFVGTNMEKLCFKQPSDVLYDPLLELPVISSKTNLTYINYYCAQCNNDAMDLLRMSYKMECVNMSQPGVRHKYLYTLQFPSANDFNMGEIYTPQHYLLAETQQKRYAPSGFGNKDYVSQAKSVLRREKGHIFGNSADVSRSCIIKNKTYKSLWGSSYVTSSCGLWSTLDRIHECHAKWENKEDFEKCRSYSLPASISGTEYKNPHCAKCNFEDMTLLNVPCRFY